MKTKLITLFIVLSSWSFAQDKATITLQTSSLDLDCNSKIIIALDNDSVGIINVDYYKKKWLHESYSFPASQYYDLLEMIYEIPISPFMDKKEGDLTYVLWPYYAEFSTDYVLTLNNGNNEVTFSVPAPGDKRNQRGTSQEVGFKQYEKVCRNILKLAHLKPKKMGIKYYSK